MNRWREGVEQRVILSPVVPVTGQEHKTQTECHLSMRSESGQTLDQGTERAQPEVFLSLEILETCSLKPWRICPSWPWYEQLGSTRRCPGISANLGCSVISWNRPRRSITRSMHPNSVPVIQRVMLGGNHCTPKPGFHCLQRDTSYAWIKLNHPFSKTSQTEKYWKKTQNPFPPTTCTAL